MPFKLEDDNLYDNQWTNAIVERKEFWEKFAIQNNYDINGTYSNFGVEFNILIDFNGVHMQIYGHRNFANINNTFGNPDIYNEVFEIKMYSKRDLAIPKSRSFRRNFFGWIISQFYAPEKAELNNKYNIVFGAKHEYKLLKNLGLTDLNGIDKIVTNSQKVIIRTSILPFEPVDLKKIERIIKNLKNVA